MLKIENLSVKVHRKDILEKVSLEIQNGEVHTLLSPDVSGKSTLAYAVMGFPEYNITEGRIYFKSKDVTGLSIEERVNLGITLAFQHPS